MSFVPYMRNHSSIRVALGALRQGHDSTVLRYARDADLPGLIRLRTLRARSNPRHASTSGDTLRTMILLRVFLLAAFGMPMSAAPHRSVSDRSLRR